MGQTEGNIPSGPKADVLEVARSVIEPKLRHDIDHNH